ncbi:hypothetical protein ACWDVX_21880 [Streptomyces tendae]
MDGKLRGVDGYRQMSKQVIVVGVGLCDICAQVGGNPAAALTDAR